MVSTLVTEMGGVKEELVGVGTGLVREGGKKMRLKTLGWFDLREEDWMNCKNP